MTLIPVSMTERYQMRYMISVTGLKFSKGPSEGPRCNSIGYSDTYLATGILLLVLV